LSSNLYKGSTIKLLVNSAVLALLLASATAGAEVANLAFKKCQIQQGAQSVDAECAVLIRAENPELPDGKQIDLFVARFASSSPNPEEDAFTVIQGGPGGSSIDMFLSMRHVFAAIRSKRDILVVDQRGTGRSNALLCPDPDETLVLNPGPEEVKEMTQKCIDGLDADLEFYTTSIAVQDLDAVRAAAGYAQLSIYGVSYGTRVAQHYLRRFPNRVRALIIDGVTPVGLNLAGGEIAKRSQAALDAMFDRCSSDTACTAKLGDLRQKFSTLRNRLAEEPVEVALAHPVTGDLLIKTYSEAHLLASIRLMPYSTEQLALLPMMISKAEAGDYRALAAHSVVLEESFFENFAIGMNNSVMCAEDQPFVDPSDLSNVADTYMGSDQADAVAAVCSVWPRGVIDEDFLTPFSSDRPVLLLSGENDPITPPANGEQAAAMFSNSKHLTVPAHGHGVIGRGCVTQLATNFIENPNFEEFDAACIERERAVPFFFDYSGPTP
jgi:pimeloyl-ACP methyl ester carboxylesterase